MPSLKVAAASLPITKDIETNANTIQRAISYAVGERADILLTPEGSLSGYTHVFDQSKTAVELDRIRSKAEGGGLALALGTCFFESDGLVYNQVRLYDKAGSFLGFHSKTLLCGTMADSPVGEVNKYATKELEVFELEGITVGGLICNDLWANPMCTPMPDPHLTQQLAGMGAKIIFHAVNGGRGDDEWRQIVWNYHEANLRMRAKAGKLWIVTVDNSDPPKLQTSSPCGVVRPDGSWAHLVKGRGEQLFTFTIEL